MPELVPIEIPPNTVMLKGLDWDSNIYFVRSGREALIVDTGTGKRARDYIGLLAGEGYLNGLREVVIFNTHEHFDHIGGNLTFKSLLEGLGIKVSFATHRIVAEIIERGLSGIILDHAYGERFKPHEVHIKLKDGDELKVGKLRLNVIHTPGHTAGSSCLYLDGDTKLMFTGDTVFNRAVGRMNLPTGSLDELRKSLRKLTGFEVDFGLPGHGWIIKDWKGNLKRVMP
nr:MBL fold metallo-hydrolase [Thermococcus sp.]